MRTIIYCRKSTDREDRQVQSLGDQKKWCEEMAKSLDYEVVDIISEAISGKNPEARPGFKKMLKMLKEGKADRIITWKANRLARNPIDQSYIEWYLQEGIIQEILSSDGFFRTGDNVLILRMHFGMATQYSIDLKKDTVRGMRSKVESGGIVAKPPRGYSIENGEAVPDHEAQVIKDIFELRAQGWGMPDIAKEVYKKYHFQTKSGKAVMHTYISKVLANPFYYGAIQWSGEIFSGRHDPIVEKSLWDKVNGIQRGTSYEKHAEKDYFGLRGIVLNGETGAILTASFLKGKYVYFHTTTKNGKKIYFNQQAIFDWFDANIRHFVIPKKLHGPVKKYFLDILKGEQDDTNLIRKKLKRKENDAIMAKQRLLTMRVNEEITQEEFLEEKNRLTSELYSTKSMLLDVDKIDENILDTVDTIMSFCTNLESVWKSADLPQKIDIVKLLIINLFIGENNVMNFKFFPLWHATYEVNKNPQLLGDFGGELGWLPNIVRSSDSSPLMQILAGFAKESHRIEKYKEMLTRL